MITVSREHKPVAAKEPKNSQIRRSVLNEESNTVDAAIATNFVSKVFMLQTGNLGIGDIFYRAQGFMVNYFSGPTVQKRLDGHPFLARTCRTTYGVITKYSGDFDPVESPLLPLLCKQTMEAIFSVESAQSNSNGISIKDHRSPHLVVGVKFSSPDCVTTTLPG